MKPNKHVLVGVVLLIGLLAMAVVTYGGGWGGVRATGGSLTVSGEGYGLGAVDQVQVSAQLSGYIVCVNNGTNIAPGQTSFTTSLTKTKDTEVRNGRFSFTIEFSDAEILGDQVGSAGCPNSNWVHDYLHHLLTFTLNEIENGVVVERTAATFVCQIEPPALSGEYVCSQQ